MSNIQHIIDGDTGQQAADKINAGIDEINALDARFDAKYDASNPDGFVDDAGVSANADVAANTASRHDPVSLGGAPNYITLVGQIITRNLIDLANHVTGRLGFSNLPTGTARSVVGRAGSGNGDVANITAGNNTVLSRSGSGNVAFNDPTTVKAILSLENVDNTSDADKPISTATQAALDGKEDAGLNVVALGNISGATAINLSQGSTFTGNLTDAITLSFTNVPTGGAGIVLEFTGVEQITFPVGGNAVGGDIPEATAGRYKYILTVRASGDYDIDGLIDNIEAVV